MRLAIVASHPVQYHAPLFRELAKRLDLEVLFACRPSAADQGAGFDVPFLWDSDLASGYRHAFLTNVAARPNPSRFSGCDTPGVARRLKEGGFDGVLVMGWHLKSFWQTVVGCRVAGIPVMVRGDSQLGTPRGRGLLAAKALLYPLGLRAFSAALYVGQRSREYFEAYGYPASRLFFSPHAVDNCWFADRATPAAGRGLRTRLGASQNERLLLFAGKLIDFKRPLDVVAAAERLRVEGRNVSVLVAGSGPLQEALRAAATTSGVPLRFAGFLNQSEMPAAYAAADLLVLPSTGRETWGLVANEALACGLPILVSDAVGCTPDLAADRAVGGVFPVGDVEALARVAGELLDNPPPACSIAARAQTYSVSAGADGVVAALSAVSAGKDAPSWT